MKNSKNITKLSMSQKKYLNQLLDLNIEENAIYEEVDGIQDSISDIRETKDVNLENEKNKITKPEPNPDTGEVPLRTGVAAALLDKKGPKPNVEKQSKSEVELSKKKSKIKINPDVEMGVFSGGKKTNQGSELY